MSVPIGVPPAGGALTGNEPALYMSGTDMESTAGRAWADSTSAGSASVDATHRPSRAFDTSSAASLDAQALESAGLIGRLHARGDTTTETVASSRTDTSATEGPMLGMAGVGKTVLGLALILLLIWAMAALLKRLGPARGLRGRALNVVANQSLGGRERVVVVEIDSTWLVLGVSPGGVSRLHEMPAAQREDAEADRTGAPEGADRPGFSDSFKRALAERFNRRS